MYAVWSWLRELVDLDQDVSAEEAARALTGAGLEVEAITSIGDGFSGVVVAEVVGKRQHPQADRLTLVEVIDQPGGPVTEVVCGAPNVPEPGGRVLWARPGAVLPGNMKIGKRKLKGVESAGMLCAEDELGLGDDHDGIIVLREADVLHGTGELLGDPNAIERLGLRDTVLEIATPANRPDVLGHLGIARELAALFGGRMRPISTAIDDLVDPALVTDALISVDIEDPEGCPRYVARIIDGVRVAPSPRWMQHRLRAVGVRPLSNLVDITNYVMFELGQPLHAFDYAAIADGTIRVRRAGQGERITTLDGVERALESADLLICDTQGPVALAGVMGGAHSEVADTTTRVLLEAASFAPEPVRHTARRLGMHSEASHRFERGVDPNMPVIASARAAQLLARLGGGQNGGRISTGVVDVYPRPAEPRRVSLRASRASQLTGVDIGRDVATTLLGRLGLEVIADPADADRLQVTCPTSRPDLTREVDLIEEVIRIHGLDKVPATLPTNQIPLTRRVDSRPVLARRALVAAGMSEAITFGFTSLKRIESLRLPADDRRARPVALRNPMSAEQAVMRTSLLPNLLAAVARNVSFGVTDVGMFEIGNVFLANQPGALPDEPMHVAGVLCGTRAGWLMGGGEVDVFDIKGALECMLAALLVDQAEQVRFEADASVPYMHPGVCARVILPDGTMAGHVGELRPATRNALDVGLPCFGFELVLELFPPPEPVQMHAIPRYPAVTRDISLLMDEGVPAARVRQIIDEAARQDAATLVERVTVLEDYRDPDNVPAGKKGMLWSITYRSAEGTLTDVQVDTAHEGIVARLLDELPARRR